MTRDLQLGEAVLRRLFLGKLPLYIQRQFSIMRDLSLDDLAKRADEAYEVGNPYLGTSRKPTGIDSRPQQPLYLSNVMITTPYVSIMTDTLTKHVTQNLRAVGVAALWLPRETRLLQANSQVFSCTLANLCQ